MRATARVVRRLLQHHRKLLVGGIRGHRHIQCDEIWAFIHCKEGHRQFAKASPRGSSKSWRSTWGCRRSTYIHVRPKAVRTKLDHRITPAVAAGWQTAPLILTVATNLGRRKVDAMAADVAERPARPGGAHCPTEGR